MSKEKQITPILNRLKSLYNVHSSTSLSKLMDVPKGTFDNWSARDNIPMPKLKFFAEKFGVNLDWLIDGTGDKFKLPENTFLTKEVSDALIQIAKTAHHRPQDKLTSELSTLFSLLSPQAKVEVFGEIKEIIKKKL